MLSLALHITPSQLYGWMVVGFALALALGLLVHRFLRLRRELGAEQQRGRSTAETFEALVAASPLATALLDEEWRVAGVWNPAAERLFGWSRSEIDGRPLPITSPERRAQADVLRDRLLAGERVSGVRVRRLRSDGTPMDLLVAAAPVNDPVSGARRFLVILDDVTADVAAAERLVAQATLIDNLQDPIIATDLEYRITLWNCGAERLYGWTSAEALGQRGPDLLRTVPVEEPGANLIRRLERDEEFQGEVIHHHRDGTPVRVEARTRPLRDADGALTGWVASIRDISARRAAEEALRESEARIHRIADNALDLIYRYRLGPDPGFEYVSPGATAMVGYTPEEHYADPALGLKLVHPEDRHLLDALREDPESLTRKPLVLRWVHRNGQVIWTEQRNALVRDAEGRVVALEGIARDITDRRRTEERLALLSRALEQSAELVVITDPDGRIEYVNPAFERVTGWRAAEVIGQTPAVLKSGQHPPEVYADLWTRVTAGRTWTGQFRNRRKDGTLFLADVVISAVRGADGGIINLVGVQRDITRERELDDQLRQAQKMEAVGQLTGGIAHDFNNLLTVILANVSLLRDSIGGAAPASESYLLDIQTAARRGGEMVKKLLAFGRQERLDLGSLQLDRVVGDFLGTLRRLLPESVELRFEAPAGLPPVEADLGAVEQILLNLVTNARDAMPKGGTLTITLELAAAAPGGSPPSPEGWMHLVVRDEGEGMEPTVLARVFEPFFTTKPTGKGTGLGMAMVYGLVKQQRGLIEVDSNTGSGTTVHVWLPATRPRPVEPATGVATAPRGRGETILLAEDEAPIRRAATRILEGLGYTVLAARDGIEALELFAAHERDVALVISDVTMPRLNGPDLLEALRARGARVPVLFATGYAVRRSTPGEGALRFLEKPWTVEELASRVQEALEPGRSGAPA